MHLIIVANLPPPCREKPSGPHPSLPKIKILPSRLTAESEGPYSKGVGAFAQIWAVGIPIHKYWRYYSHTAGLQASCGGQPSHFTHLVVVERRGPKAPKLASSGQVLVGGPEHGHGQDGDRKAPQAEHTAHGLN